MGQGNGKNEHIYNVHTGPHKLCSWRHKLFKGKPCWCMQIQKRTRIILKNEEEEEEEEEEWEEE